MSPNKHVLSCLAVLLSSGVGLVFSAPVEMTGTVIDAATNAPLQGAYVVAIYEESVGNMLVTVQRCRKLKGMTTGPDGRFSFPVEKLDGQSPSSVRAVIPGYYLYKLGGDPDPSVWKRQGPEAYANRTVLMTKQDELKPLFDYDIDSIFCKDAKSRVDVQPALEYLRIIEGELRKYHADKSAISDIESLKGTLEAIPK